MFRRTGRKGAARTISLALGRPEFFDRVAQQKLLVTGPSENFLASDIEIDAAGAKPAVIVGL
jgi:hypothetical protein